MARALQLAERGLFTTQPNPRVGCVIAHGDEVVGTGFHQRAGEPHAEVFALREAGVRARGATAHVTLEPCAHHGRTPPCADALITAGVQRVVIASEDPFPQVNGRGIDKLRAAGITVETGLLREAARELNIGFFSRIERGRPFVRVKLAMSLDGRTALANGESKWITGEAARADVQRWRARSSAILSSSGTVLADNPRLTVRLPEDEAFNQSLRVILDRQLRTPSHSHVLDGSMPTLLLHGAAPGCADDRFARVERMVVATRNEMLDLHAVLGLLAGRGCNEVHVEAGPTLCGALFAAGLADELLLYVAPLLLGDSARPLLQLPTLADMAQRWQLSVKDQRQLGADWRLRLRPA
ncbi:bifunctional diaminohydroxyphosphoribosylaminopyrimidine deaminase/5-amino-6-(5-phosphoribosylamino)uracil reductase RibD [Rhodanobacter sp. AS-Z3]|uniref:bifunctional diaminohydroxyphosphoribosylaminopyrimidine deaminase/5-amino-6-(5-phosphoribosylamino)uracil reductase RibD n=1 Tax=Rhodanobacter sp. AS-Z3 TaxID=3031330 RepID=UPI00247892CE|nr:bifunctional diaminohydroxyphosphoribosylaminopyrimidine deaminase/5-amino-6-(5-phosphoribosylamino)uracil reductase RibD [Rhodanobacter sp. AS-Z3]WEN16830.1 bifunctional diaminohydroxyphosphoribosylaminopyrimidine deaminase/5-amino-6-(5-phosphoribosylamino)uracil reductase RibD [Rhodanobacter sp. AS-Z3]